MTGIDLAAMVEPGAEAGEGIAVGRRDDGGPEVALQNGVRPGSYLDVAGRMAIGRNAPVRPFASIGTPPRDLEHGARIPASRSARATPPPSLRP